MLINTDDSAIISPDAHIVCASALMEHDALSERGTAAEPRFVSAQKYLFSLAVYVHLNFTPGEENNKSISILVDCFPMLSFQNLQFQNISVKV